MKEIGCAYERGRCAAGLRETLQTSDQMTVKPPFINAIPGGRHHIHLPNTGMCLSTGGGGGWGGWWGQRSGVDPPRRSSRAGPHTSFMAISVQLRVR